MFKWFIGSFLRKNHLSLYCVVFFFAIAWHGQHLPDDIRRIRLEEIAVAFEKIVHQGNMLFGFPDMIVLKHLLLFSKKKRGL